MAMKVAKSARLGFRLDAGTNPTTGNAIRESVSISKIMPNSDVDALGDTSAAVKTLFVKPTLEVSLVETSQIV